MFFTILLIISNIILSLGTSIHILLTKRNPSVAVGWIGACWFKPWIGVLIYYLFGINRVKRKAQKLIQNSEEEQESQKLEQWKEPLEGSFAPLVHMLDQITTRPLVGGNEIIAMHDGDNLYPLMLAEIEKSRHSVLLCSYIFRYDDLGEKFIEALIRAHQRGVEVRVLVDGIGSGYFYCKTEKYLKRAGIKAARFMHSFLLWKMPLVNLRNHRKILIIDGVRGFMGGLNIGAENILARPVPKMMSVSDTHFYLEGPIICQLTEAFIKDWNFTTGESLTALLSFPEIERRGSKKARIVTSGPDEDIEKIEYTLLQAISLARGHICIMTPYFIPDMRFSTELGLAARRGVKVDIIVPAHSNHAFTDAARNACLERLIEVGCHIYFSNPPFNHSKLMVIDDIWSFVGSANLDARSLRLNFEINFECYDQKIATYLVGFMLKHAHHSLLKEEIEGWSLRRRLYNAIACLFSPYL